MTEHRLHAKMRAAAVCRECDREVHEYTLDLAVDLRTDPQTSQIPVKCVELLLRAECACGAPVFVRFYPLLEKNT